MEDTESGMVTLPLRGTSEKAALPIIFTESEMVTLVRAVQSLKTSSPIFVTESERARLRRDLQRLKACLSMSPTELPMVTLVRDPQSWNVFAKILVTELLTVTLVRAWHLLKALCPRFVTESGIVTLVSLVHPLKAICESQRSVCAADRESQAHQSMCGEGVRVHARRAHFADARHRVGNRHAREARASLKGRLRVAARASVRQSEGQARQSMCVRRGAAGCARGELTWSMLVTESGMVMLVRLVQS